MMVYGIYPEESLRPVYCGVCGKPLEERLLEDGYDIYTGEKVNKTFLVCRTLNQYHDAWEFIDNEWSKR